MPRIRSLATAVLAVFIAAICACDVSRNEPIAACVEYATKVRACFGERAGSSLMKSFSKPPADPSAREALEAKCTQGKAQIARSCR